MKSFGCCNQGLGCSDQCETKIDTCVNKFYFKGVKTLPVQYVANQDAWMTAVIFCDWLLSCDKELKRPILLLVDNCIAHNVDVTFKNIRMVFLPANTTSIIQPCDQRII